MNPVLAIVSGLIYAAAFPKWDLHFLIFIFMLPLLFSGKRLSDSKNFSFLKSFRLFLIAGTSANIVLLYWIPEVMIKYGNAPYAIGVLALILLSALLAVFPGLAGYFIIKELKRGYLAAITIPAIWVTKDYVLEWAITGFPWCSAGYSQYSNLKMIQLAEFGGVHLITFIIISINVLIYRDIADRKLKGTSLSVLTLVLVLTAGYFLQERYEEKNLDSEKLKAAIIQPNYSDNRKNTIKKLNLLMENSERLVSNGAEFIVWPEYTVSIYPAQQIYFKKLFEKFAAEQAPLIGGFTDLQGTNGTYNSVFLFSKGKIEKYDKVHLVPFGEYVPLRWLFFFFQKITDEVHDFTPGKDTLNLTLKGHKIATPICYEIIFPNLVRSFTDKGAELIVTCSNDAWYGISSAPGQLLAMSVLRSVENRRYNIRSVSTGISAFIAPTGEIKSSIPLNVTSSRTEDVYFIKDKTLFTAFGYRFPWICLLIFLTTILFRTKDIKIKKSKNEKKRKN